jgi:hypothetical protein
MLYYPRNSQDLASLARSFVGVTAGWIIVVRRKSQRQLEETLVCELKFDEVDAAGVHSGAEMVTNYRRFLTLQVEAGRTRMWLSIMPGST